MPDIYQTRLKNKRGQTVNTDENHLNKKPNYNKQQKKFLNKMMLEIAIFLVMLIEEKRPPSQHIK
jgi:hypothetical protein